MVHHSHNEMTNLPNVPKEPKMPKRFGVPSTVPTEVATSVVSTRFGTFGRFGSFGIFDQRGAVSVEMVFFLLIFAVTFFGSVEMAREISVKHALDVGTYRAARYLSLVPNDTATARTMVQTELDNNVLGGAGTLQIMVDMPSQSFQSVFSVTAQVPYQPVVPLIVFAPKTLTVTHSQSIEKYP